MRQMGHDAAALRRLARRRPRDVGRRHGLPPAARGHRGARGRGRRTASSAISATTAPTRRRSPAGWRAATAGRSIPAAIVTTHGVVAGLALCLQAFTEPGDGVILFTPVYHAFYRVIARQRPRDRRVARSSCARTAATRMDLDGARRRADRPRAHASSSARRTTPAAGSGAADGAARARRLLRRARPAARLRRDPPRPRAARQPPRADAARRARDRSTGW